MAEEFEESEVVFEGGCDFQLREFAMKTSSCSKKKQKQKQNSTLPVSIPENVSWARCDILEDEGEIVPPHLIVGRRKMMGMGFSVCTGNGRTLKGRDLSQVRNSILRLTGFLET